MLLGIGIFCALPDFDSAERSLPPIPSHARVQCYGLSIYEFDGRNQRTADEFCARRAANSGSFGVTLRGLSWYPAKLVA